MPLMPRWMPDARERLVGAAIQLFSEQGYDATTVSQIAERAGLTRSTFHRHFGDKRDVLAAGQDMLAGLLRDGAVRAPAGSTPLAAVESALLAAAGAMTPDMRERGSRMHAVIAASAELRERDQLKHVGLAAALAEALQERGIGPRVAEVAAEMGLLAFKNAYALWIEQPDAEDAPPLEDLVRDELDALRTALGDLD